jgi:hypothetical protein
MSELISLEDPYLFRFADQNADHQAIWKETRCAICGLPAIGLIVATLHHPDLPDLPMVWGTPEQQSFLEVCRQQSDANWDMPVCEIHAEGTVFN